MSYCDKLRQRAMTSCDGLLRQIIATDRDTDRDMLAAEVN